MFNFSEPMSDKKTRQTKESKMGSRIFFENLKLTADKTTAPTFFHLNKLSVRKISSIFATGISLK